MLSKPRNVRELLTQARAAQADLAIAHMRLPKADPYEHGVAVGRWQGVDALLDEIEETMKTKESE